MYKASITENCNYVSIVVRDDDAPSKPVHLLPMSVNEALMVRLWLVGLHDQNSPFELKLHGKEERWLEYEVWAPIRDSLNIWYEAYYAPL